MQREALMLTYPSPPVIDTETPAPTPLPAARHLLAGLPGLGTIIPPRMTAEKNGRKMLSQKGGIAPMKVLLAAQAGLFADAFSGSLTKLARRVQVERCDPERVRDLEPDAGFSIVLIDTDAVPGRAASLVSACRDRVPGTAVIALASALDDSFIATIMKAGAQAYLPKSYSETQALGVLQVVLGGASHRPSADAASNEPESSEPVTGLPPLGGRRSGTYPYGLTGRELQALSHMCEGRSNLEIAKRLGITEGTVKIHLSNSYKKLGVENRAQAIRIVERLEHVRALELEEAEEGSSLRDWLLPHMVHETHRKGEVLFKKGDPGRTLYYIQQGMVALPEISKQMSQGELFGEIGIFGPARSRTCTARCETDAQLFCLTAEQAKRLYFENPQFAFHVMQLIARRLLDDQARPH
jgi:two-component system, NarL family, nitrate/nitrite response regulator NarL